MTLRFAFVIAVALTTLMVLGCGTADDFYTTPDTTPPLSPAISGSSVSNGSASLWWEANTEADLAGYNVYSVANGEATRVNSQMLGVTYYSHFTNTPVDLYVTAVDVNGNESGPSASQYIAVNRNNTPDPIERLPKELPTQN